MKKLLAAILAFLLPVALFCGCDTGSNEDNLPDTPPSEGEQTPPEEETPPEEDGHLDDLKVNLSADGYVKGKISDFSIYEGTDAYRKVTTAEELIKAISDAKYHYTNVWNEETKTYTQVPAEGFTQENFEGTVHVIEIANDLNLGYYKLSAAAKAYTSIVGDFAPKANNTKEYLSYSDMFTENGISQIKVENTSNLLIYSKNGAKLTHCGFKLTSDTNVVFRNLEFDEIWQWEDAPRRDSNAIGDYDAFGWAYFKIAFCGYVWIDHCTFGKSYDGQIDYSNPVYDANAGTAFRAPYGADGNNGLHISWCNFNAGSDDKDGYIYKMMEKIEQNYQDGGEDYLYYKALRDGGASFEDVLYGVAIPQKKGFLCGDDAKFSGSYDNADDYNFNLKLQVSFANCKFINLEDRLPKLRGGNAYMYNCVVDSSQYYVYRTKLKSLNAASLVSAINSKWKCGLVSQGIVCGNGGSVKAENCIFRGVDQLLKNNDTKNSGEYVKGGYLLINCSYQKSATDEIYTGSSSDTGAKFPNASTSTLTTALFKWHTEDNGEPFTIASYGLDDLEEILANGDYGSGVTGDYLDLLKSSVN